MATVRSIVTDALREIVAIGQNETPSAPDAQLALLRLQNQIDSWAADSLTLAIQNRVTFTLVSGDNEMTIGPSGNINTSRPVWIDGVNYIVPGSSPEVEVPLGQLNNDQYVALSIKDLSSGLPQQYFFQSSYTTALGSLFFWPTPDQNVGMVIYFPAAVGVPATLDSILLGPPGYQEAFMYQLAWRLCTPFGKQVPDLLPTNMREATARMKRQNLVPGLLGIDAALVPQAGAGYNVLSDTTMASRNG